MKWVLASFNPGKLKEMQALMPDTIEMISIAEWPDAEEPEENADTLEGNALIKAEYAYALTGYPSLADDTGLFVAALNGAPGVYSARYAGEPADSQKNIQKLLSELQEHSNRRAEFRTVIALVGRGEPLFFTGVLKGSIALKPSGTKGFGYDSVFKPEGSEGTLAEYSPEEKNAISHRGKAMRALSAFVRTLY